MDYGEKSAKYAPVAANKILSIVFNKWENLVIA